MRLIEELVCPGEYEAGVGIFETDVGLFCYAFFGWSHPDIDDDLDGISTWQPSGYFESLVEAETAVHIETSWLKPRNSD